MLRSLLVSLDSPFHAVQAHEGSAARPPLAQAEELVDVLAAELVRRSSQLAEAHGRVQRLEQEGKQLTEDLHALESRLK